MPVHFQFSCPSNTSKAYFDPIEQAVTVYAQCVREVVWGEKGLNAENERTLVVDPIFFWWPIYVSLFLLFLRKVLCGTIFVAFCEYYQIPTNAVCKIVESLWAVFIRTTIAILDIVLFVRTYWVCTSIVDSLFPQISLGNVRGEPLLLEFFVVSVQTGYYVFDMYALFMLAESKKYALLVCGHHLVALNGLFGALLYSEWRLPLQVTALHDVCDPFLHIARLAHYLYELKGGKFYDRCSKVSLAMFMVQWVFFRTILFPLFVLTIFKQDLDRDLPYGACAFSCCLVLQLGLDFYWTALLVPFILKALWVKKGVSTKDKKH